jgi:hypothetical protein
MRILKVNEINLSLKELDKRSNGDILVKKIKEEDPIQVNKIRNKATLKKGEITVINQDDIIPNITDDEGHYDREKGKDFFSKGRRYKEVIDGGDQMYQLNDIEKTADFGSTGGSSLGTHDTRDVETIQCFFLSYRQYKRSPILSEDIDSILEMEDDLFEHIKKFVESQIDVTKELIEKYIERGWVTTFIKTANAIFRLGEEDSGFRGRFLIDFKKIYKFCQISSETGVVNIIKNTYRKCGKKISISKWNPSDVWMVEKKSELRVIDGFRHINNIKELNNYIDNSFDNRKLIGLSLKKVSEKEDIKIIANKVTAPPRYTYNNVRVSQDATSTTGLKILVERRRNRDFSSGIESMTVRSKQGSVVTNIMGEVDGVMSRHGQISLTRINEILKKYDIERVPMAKSSGPAGESFYELGLETWTDDELKEEINIINDDIIEHYGEDIVARKVSRQYQENRARLVSKYQSLFLVWILMENASVPSELPGLSISDRIVEEMFHYALAINTGHYRTPKYVRVVD